MFLFAFASGTFIDLYDNSPTKEQKVKWWWQDNLWWVIILSVLLIAAVSCFIYCKVRDRKQKIESSTHEVICFGKRYSVKHGSTFTPDTPQKKGANFLGWYRDINCTIPWYSTDTVNKNMELYPKWEYNAD